VLPSVATTMPMRDVAGAWPLAVALGLGVAAMLCAVIADLCRSGTPSSPTRRPTRRRRPPLLWGAFAMLACALAMAVWCALADAGLLAVRQELPLVSMVLAAAIAGLAAAGWALRILALPRDSRSEGDGVALAVAATFALGVGGCYGVLVVPQLLADLFR